MQNFMFSMKAIKFTVKHKASKIFNDFACFFLLATFKLNYSFGFLSVPYTLTVKPNA